MNVQRGFTLTELLVAMAIGMVIILGAGQLFLSTFHTFRQVDALGRQQEALIYTATTVASTLRRSGSVDANEEPLFRLQCSYQEPVCRCTVQDMQAAQPLVSFNQPGDGPCAKSEALGTPENSSAGVSVVALPLGPGGRDVRFHVAHRNHVLRLHNE